jgi:hypothetical protein
MILLTGDRRRVLYAADSAPDVADVAGQDEAGHNKRKGMEERQFHPGQQKSNDSNDQEQLPTSVGYKRHNSDDFHGLPRLRSRIALRPEQIIGDGHRAGNAPVAATDPRGATAAPQLPRMAADIGHHLKAAAAAPAPPP